jgi:hypothetical protein
MIILPYLSLIIKNKYVHRTVISVGSKKRYLFRIKETFMKRNSVSFDKIGTLIIGISAFQRLDYAAQEVY